MRELMRKAEYDVGDRGKLPGAVKAKIEELCGNGLQDDALVEALKVRSSVPCL